MELNSLTPPDLSIEMVLLFFFYFIDYLFDTSQLLISRSSLNSLGGAFVILAILSVSGKSVLEFPFLSTPASAPPARSDSRASFFFFRGLPLAFFDRADGSSVLIDIVFGHQVAL